ASGSARLTRGRNANDSTSLAGPRSSGVRSEDPTTRLRSATTFRRPSEVRTAQAHEVGPCTSTPFTRAIPPRRIFSSLLRSGCSPCGGDPLPGGRGARAKRGLERSRGLAGGAGSYGLSVELDDGDDLADRRRGEGLLRAREMVERVGALLDAVAGLGREL